MNIERQPRLKPSNSSIPIPALTTQVYLHESLHRKDDSLSINAVTVLNKQILIISAIARERATTDIARSASRWYGFLATQSTRGFAASKTDSADR